MSNDFHSLQKKLDYRFRDLSLLETAITHSSYANENRKNGSVSNERLEFLGDSVLGMAAATSIYNNKPYLSEGRMTKLRAVMVCEKSLAELAKELRLGEYLLLGRGEEKGGGRERPSILADAVEAVIAAVYLDGGFAPVVKMVAGYLSPKADKLESAIMDFKTELQEIVQEKPGQALSYHTVDEIGPDHLKVFIVEARLDGAVIGSGEGGSKKEAEQAAAKSALETVAGNRERKD